MLNQPPIRRRQAGMSLVELLVGVTVGVFIVGGAIAMFAINLKTSRQMLVEARVSQDLRAAADVIARDLRRAGYWENAIASTITDSGGLNTTRSNNDSVAADSGNSQITYSVARDTASSRSASNNTMNDDEQFGFRLSGGVLQMQVGVNNWQPLTDPNIVTINSFALTAAETPISVPDACPKTCTSDCPVVGVRSYLLQLQGTATSDSAVVRVLQERIRVRNDEITGTCPA